jgi:ADP-dependent NAD(P)H-hydrate dehydratase / NAD(P)H-hydrate epimerase
VIPLHSPAQVRELDARAIAAGTPGLELMERAAGHLARGVVGLAGRGYGLRVAVLCGKGNNGGDGLAAARVLLAAGAQPIVHLAEPDGLAGDAAVQLDRWRAAGGRMAASAKDALAGADVAVDALLGTGAAGPPREPYAALVACLRDRPEVPVVACDLPSGVDAATGAVPTQAVRADLTVTFGAHKIGLWLWPARGHCGRLELGDIGLGSGSPAAHVLEPADVARLLPPPDAGAEKRTTGVVVVLAGSPGMSGAATLVARGALAAGAGLVTVATAAEVRAEVAAAVPEALTLGLPYGGPGADPDAAFDRLADRLAGADALAVGPGLGHEPSTVALVHRLVREAAVPVVLDADGLNAFRGDGDALADHAAPLLVLTPHRRELARLVGRDEWDDRLRTVAALAERWAAVVVAKGPGSVVAGTGSPPWVNPTGGPALATGGTGDVLTGMLAALVGQDARPEAVAAGVWLHGLAGEVAGRRTHPRSVTALDVAAAVGGALRRLTRPDPGPRGMMLR